MDKCTWKRVRLGDVITRSRKQVDPIEAGIERYVAGGHIASDSITVERWGDPTDGQMGSTFRYVFQPDQILFVSARPYLRKMGVVAFSGVVADKTYVLDAIPENGLLQEFLPFVLSSDRFVEYATSEATGSMNPRLLWGPLQRYEFDLPPLQEQKRIADLLWAVENESRARAGAVNAWQELRAAHLQDRMHSIAATSGTVDLDALIEPGRPITYGILMPGTGHPGGVPVVKVRDFPEGHIKEEGLLLTSPELAYEYRRSTLKSGDLLISIRGTVGRLAEVPASLDGANITQDTARLTIAPEHDRRFVRLVLESDFVRTQIRRHTTGLAVKGLNIGALRKLQIPVPSVGSSEHDLVREAAEIEEAIRRAEDTLSASRDLGTALLAEVFGDD